MDTPLDIVAIIENLPHRFPFLLIDRVVELIEGEKIRALKNVTINEPFFQGHFPSQPVMPGVLIVEAMAQAGGVLASVSWFKDRKGSLMYFMGIDKARFRQQVVPGDRIFIEVSVMKRRRNVVRLAATATVDEVLVAEAELLAMIGEQA